MFAIELLERKCRSSAALHQLPQCRDTKRVLCGVVVDLTEQNEAMA